MISEQQRNAFLQDGYLVVPDVIPGALCDDVVAAILDFTGIDLGDPATWYDERFAGLGIVPLHHHPSLWALRQYPALYEAFRDLYGQDALWVSMDRVSYKPPASDRTRDWARAAIHWDCDPWSFDAYSLQGLVYLTDTDADQGAFACVPSIYRNLDDWRAAHADDPDRRQPDVPDDELVPVPGKAGSLVVFNRLMPHTNRINLAARPRLVQYVTMQPAGDDTVREQRVREWRERLPPEWAIRQKVPGQQIPEPWPTFDLSPLGRKLVGLDAWR